MAKIKFVSRLAFGNAIFEAKSFQGEGKADFNCAFLIDPNDDKSPHPSILSGKQAVEALRAEEAAVAKAKWGEKADAMLKSIAANNRLALKDGDTKAEYDGYPGNMFVNARSSVRPLVIDRDRTPLTAADGRIYSGCYVVGEVELWAQDNSYGKRINATLKGIQFLRDGDAFGAGGSASNADDFADLGVDNGDDSGADSLV